MTIGQASRKLSRVARRAWFQLTEARGASAGAIEEQMTFWLFRRAAQTLGLEAREIGRVLCLESGGRRFRLCGTATELDTFPVGALAGDKVAIRRLFEENGLPVPQGRSFSRDQVHQAVAYGLSLGKTCIVKPARDTSSGRGVSVDLRTGDQIRRAFAMAALYSDEILVEEQVAGDSYRYLVYQGRCVSVIRREFPAVEGNGMDTVRNLALRENAGRLRTTAWTEGAPERMPLPMTGESRRALRQQGLNWNSVPEKGRGVFLSTLANFRSGGTFSECIDGAHPAPMRIAERAAETVGMVLAGVDLITTDPALEACHIIEINTTPSMPMHYFIRNRAQGRDPIGMILRDYYQIPPAGVHVGEAKGTMRHAGL
jgi:cyanophycin synthetase